MMIALNGKPEQIGEAATLADAVRRLGIEDPKGVAAAVDGEVISASSWGTTRLSEGQKVEVLRAVQGGCK